MSKDLFSKQATTYAKYRPNYPKELFEYIVGFVTHLKTACDIATGNGQAAAMLANYFETVFAIDSSENQIQQAVQKENIHYSVARAEQTNFAADTFDLITVAQAYHWLDMKSFEKEVTRIAKPSAIIAIWGYNIPQCGDEQLNALLRNFYQTTVGKYWDPERKFIDASYQDVLFNFEEVETPPFSITVEWNKEELSGYLSSWSSVLHFIEANQFDPVEALKDQLSDLWATQPERITFEFPVFLRLGKIIK